MNASTQDVLAVGRTVFEIVVLPGLYMLVRTLWSMQGELKTLRIILVGEDGQNGLKSEVRRLRESRHAEAEAVQEATSRLDLVEYRVNKLEKAA